MIIQIDVQPETTAFIAKAQSQGISVDEIIREALSHEEIEFKSSTTFEEWESILQELINNPTFAKAPPLSEDAFRRDSIYMREDDIL